MEDVVFILLAALVLFLLLRNVLGTQSSAATAPYQASWIKSVQADAQHAIDAINATVAGASKQIGGLAAKVESNLFHGAVKAYEKSPVAVHTAKSYAQAVQSQYYAGVGTGLGAAGGPAGAAGAIAGSAPIDFVGGFEQGIGSAVGAVKKLPAQKWLNAHINYPVDHALESAFSASTRFASKQANNFTNWVGHLL